MTATATMKDESSIASLCDMKDPVIIRDNPVTANHLYFKVERPPSVYGFRGHSKDKPSTLGLLQLLVLDKFISSVRNGTELKRMIIFVQSFEELTTINNYLGDASTIV